MLIQIQSFTGASEVFGVMRTVKFDGGTLTIQDVRGIEEVKSILGALSHNKMDADVAASQAVLGVNTPAVSVTNKKTNGKPPSKQTELPGTAAPKVEGHVQTFPPQAIAQALAQKTGTTVVSHGKVVAEPEPAPEPPVPPASEEPAAEPVDLCGEVVPVAVLHSLRWEPIVKYLYDRGWQSIDEITDVLNSTFRDHVVLARDVDPQFTRDIVETTLKNVQGEASDADVRAAKVAIQGATANGSNPYGLDMEEVRKHDVLKSLLEYMLSAGVSRDDLIPACESVKEVAPVLKTIPSIKARVPRTLMMMQGPGA